MSISYPTHVELVEVGPREQIMEAPAHPYTKELLYAYRHWE